MDSVYEVLNKPPAERTGEDIGEPLSLSFLISFFVLTERVMDVLQYMR